MPPLTGPSPDNAPAFDPSQFKLQADGTFRISIRGMASIAGIDHAGLVRSLKSAGDESALPCARLLVAQGFCPGDVSTWGETGGIPEDAAPFILEHYGMLAASPSAQARAALLAFSRVGINAYLRERLGFTRPQPEPQPVAIPALEPQKALDLIERSYGLLERFGVADDRDRLQFGDMVRNVTARGAGGLLLPPSPNEEEISLADAWLELTGQPLDRSKGPFVGKLVAAHFREEFQDEPPTRIQSVNGRPTKVKSYRRGWLLKALDSLRSHILGDGAASEA